MNQPPEPPEIDPTYIDSRPGCKACKALCAAATLHHDHNHRVERDPVAYDEADPMLNKWHGRRVLTHWSHSFMTTQVADAVELWNSLAGGLTLEPILRADGWRDADIVVTAGRIDGESGTLGFAYLPGVASDEPRTWWGDIVIDIADWNRLPDYGRTEVLAHEIGHALGLPHVDDPSALMYPSYRGVGPILGTSDEEAFYARYPERGGCCR